MPLGEVGLAEEAQRQPAGHPLAVRERRALVLVVGAGDLVGAAERAVGDQVVDRPLLLAPPQLGTLQVGGRPGQDGASLGVLAAAPVPAQLVEQQAGIALEPLWHLGDRRVRLALEPLQPDPRHRQQLAILADQRAHPLGVLQVAVPQQPVEPRLVVLRPEVLAVVAEEVGELGRREVVLDPALAQELHRLPGAPDRRAAPARSGHVPAGSAARGRRRRRAGPRRTRPRRSAPRPAAASCRRSASRGAGA